MKQIGSLFEKYKKNLRPPQASVEQEAAVVIQELTSIPVRVEQLSYTLGTRVLTLQTPSVVRSEVLKQKEAILKELQYRLGKKHGPKDLR